MYFIRTIQLAILAFVLVVVALSFTISGSLYLLLSKLFRFNPGGDANEQVASDPTILVLFSIVACLLFGLEFFRVRLARRKMDAC